MSSVFRSPSQPLTRNFKASNGVYYGTYDFMRGFFINNEAIFQDGFVLFPTEEAAAQAIYDIEFACESSANAATYPGGYTENGYEIWKDLGHELKIGVIGGRSDYFTYRTMKYVTNSYNLAAGPTEGSFYVLVDAQPSHTMSVLLDGYGQVYVARNY